MTLVIGFIVILAGLICWIGQILSFFKPVLAARIGLCELETEIDSSLFIVETKAHGLTDILFCWTLPLSALLMLLNVAHWPILALVGGGIYLYFSCIVMLNRVYLKRHGKKVGSRASQISAYVLGFVWILCAVMMILLSIIALLA